MNSDGHKEKVPNAKRRDFALCTEHFALRFSQLAADITTTPDVPVRGDYRYERDIAFPVLLPAAPAALC